MPGRTWTLLAACMGLASSLAVAAWGHDTTPTTGASPLGVPANLVTAADVRMAARGSPEQAALAWARAVQRSRPRTVLRMYTRRAVAAGGAAQIDRAVRRIGRSLGRPFFVQKDLLGFGPRVRLLVLLESYEKTGRPLHGEPVTLYLEYGHGSRRWRLDDARYLLDTYAEIERAKRR